MFCGRSLVAGALAAGVGLAAIASCSRFGPVYPSRPSASSGAPEADPDPARVVIHLALASRALASALDDAAPRSADGTFAIVGSERRYTWERGPFTVEFAHGRVVLTTNVNVTADLAVKQMHASLVLRIEAEPVVSPSYAVRL
ncbi:MAG: hypothetical protein ACRENE_15980, partial [Polyangiaceae bacterium]